MPRLLLIAAGCSVLVVCDPPNEDVCNHLFDISTKDVSPEHAPKDEDRKRFVEQCAKDLEREKEKLGPEKYKQRVRCVMEATSVSELLPCGDGEIPLAPPRLVGAPD